MKYDSYVYLWPPRPEQAIPEALIAMYDGMGWWPQVKKNGTCCIIFAKGDTVIFKGRHDNDLAAWSPLPEHIAFFQAGSAANPSADQWQVYVAELLHSKVPGIRNEFYLFDILVHSGEHIVGWTLAERIKLMRHRFNADNLQPCGHGALRIAPYFQLVDCLPRGEALKLWRGNCLGPADEGFCFKNPNAPLVACLTARANAAGQVKVRRPTRNYSF